MKIIKYKTERIGNNKPIGFEWFNNRFTDGFFLNLLNHIFPLSLFIAQKYNLNARVLVNRSITFLYNTAIDDSKGTSVKELKRWFVVLQKSVEPIDQYYLYILKRYSRTYSLAERNLEDKLIYGTIPIAVFEAERNTFFKLKNKKDQCERNIDVFRIVNEQVDYQPQSIIERSVNRYFNSFAVYEFADGRALEYLEYIQNFSSIIEKSKGVADLMLLNSSFKIFAEGNRLSKDKYIKRMCRYSKRSFATNF